MPPGHVDARLGGAEPVAADRDGVDAPARERQDDLEDDHDPDRPDQLRVGAAAEDLRERPAPSTIDVPGVVTCVAWEMISVRPSSMNSVPSVVTNDEIPMNATKKPLNSPMQHRHQQRADHRRDQREARAGSACRR